ncbi:Mitochondrial substrate/solute carrier [Penicillium cf. griseofulvum]|uniref:Mitochondrial substrate/solute carrier n=1 Tax=Penicillium cf. griseofulvum TaxID=2972120 RepID=A0A9W9IY29_9EURO|nr:Mitochondrial substrate/solute carrier [Penicillium cf. griseofulvum]KAJ5429437.1 Mitochondrial substrate/solute carrier [Penicillium cf. griseofulvum]KAJ5436780.1 Mitochondrial substrate/solute carrier [Penicillium cf. griseofulvum]
MYNTSSDIWAAGAFAAVVVDFIVYPFDTLKTRVQSPNYEKVFKDARTGAVQRNVLFRGLYQGVWSVVFSTIPASGAFFTTYEAVKSIMYNSSAQRPTSMANGKPIASEGSLNSLRLPFTHSLPTPIMHGIASSTGEMVSCIIITPAEVLKQNAQMIQGQKTNKSVMRQVLKRFRRHPWRLWSGYTALVSRNLPTTALQFPLFEYARSRLIARRRQWKATRSNTHRPPSEQSEQLVKRAGLTGIAAAFSGTVAATVTTPIDVIKTRVMLSASDSGASSQDQISRAGTRGSEVISSARTKTKPTKSVISVGRDIMRYEGIRGLFKGGLIRAGWTAIALGLYLSLYEGGRFYLENRRKERDQINGKFGKQTDGEEVI